MSTLENNIITCELMGGLGNQLFQIGATIVHGLETNRKIVFPYTEVLRTGTVRPTYWLNFLSGIKSFTKPVEQLAGHRFYIYKEDSFEYNKIATVAPYQNVRLCGYFQSYKYFDSKKGTLLKLFRINEQKKLIIDELKPSSDKNNISMHFRLGDYKNIQDYHPLATYEYYENALSFILLKKPDCAHKVIYFNQSEDNILVHEYIEKLRRKFPSVEFEKANDSIPDWKQLLLMSCCDDNIIANSTFSWWAAYFNENPSKIVCCPKIWFGPKLSHNTCDLFPADWTVL
jgi:hypothetical protein